MSDDGLTGIETALRRWRTSAIPLETEESVGERRSRTLATIASAMRQGQIDRQHSRRGRFWAVGLIAAGMLIGVGAWSVSKLDSARAVAAESAFVSSEVGKTWIWSGTSKERVDSGARRALRIGDRVVTGTGRARLRVGADTSIDVAKQSEVVLSQVSSHLKSMTLRGGTIDVDVEPRRDGRVEIETPHARIVVHGTRFSVAVSEPDEDSAATSVRVRRGIVAVISGDREVARLHAGQSWTSQKPQTKPARATLVEPSAPAEEPSVPKSVPVSRILRVAPPPANEPETVLVDASTLAEQNQMFRRAVDARNRGDDEQAVKHFDALLGKHPKSALAQEARVERFRALKRLGRNREAARAARRYLMDHTNGFAKDEARGVALTPGAAEISRDK